MISQLAWVVTQLTAAAPRAMEAFYAPYANRSTFKQDTAAARTATHYALLSR
jgi:hypothetical protein